MTLGSPAGSGKPQIQILSPDGSLKAGMGLRPSEGDGVIQVWGSKTKTGLMIGGRGQLDMYNAQFKRVVSLGVSDPGGAGDLHLYDNTGNEQVTVGSPPPGSGRPHIQVLSADGSAKVGIGINAAEGHGVIALKGGKAQTSLWLTGQGLLQALNAQDKKVVSLGVSGFGGGDLHLYNGSGTSVVGIFSEQGQTGIVQLFNAGGQERVTLGTRTTGKGDVCASGDNGQHCLGRLNPKY